MINFVYLRKIDALPLGVDRVEIGNWTKTREINEIRDDEKKLNSEKLEGIRNINFDVSINEDGSINELETFTLLYEASNTMKYINKVSSDEHKGDNTIIKGNKVLRTKVTMSNKIYSFDYNTIKTWIGSDTSVNWESGFLGSKIITWPCYVEVLEYKNSEAPIELRMLEGEFKLDKNQLELIASKKVQPVIGIESNDDFHLILPFCDLINIFINEEGTNLNYRAVSNDYKFKIDKTVVNYNLVNTAENNKYCNKEEDNILSQHTRNKHIDFNTLKSTIDNNYYKMMGDISQYIKSDVSDYKISLLIGQLGRKGEDVLNYNGGTSQISLFLIENPKFKVNIKPYIKENNEKIYISSDYRFSYKEKVLFDVEIINESSNYDYSNLDLRMDLIKEVKDGGTKISDILQINKKDAKYNGINIKNDVSLYFNDESTPYSITELSNLKKGDKLTISSDKFIYTVTEYNALKEKIFYDYNMQLNYLNNYTFYKYTNTNSLEVKPIDGMLTVTVNGSSNDYFYLKLEGENNYSTIKVKSNESYTICNLDYDKEYKLSLINSSSYKPVNSQSFVLKNISGYNKKSIIINSNPKSNNYFTQRKIDEIIMNR